MSTASILLDETAATLERFVAVLRREAEALAGHDSETLFAITQEKDELTRTIGSLWNQLCQELGSARLAPSEVRPLLSRRADAAALQALERVCRLSETARQQNQDNGMVIQQQLRHTRKALAVLQTLARQNTIYGPDGLSAVAFPTSRTIDEA